MSCKSHHREPAENYLGKLPFMTGRSILSLSHSLIRSKQASQYSDGGRDLWRKKKKERRCRGKAADSAALSAYLHDKWRALRWRAAVEFCFHGSPCAQAYVFAITCCRAPAFYFLPSCCTVRPLHFFVVPPFLHPISERNVRL